MSRIKEQALRELGDHGADTLDRYYAQVEYTAYWCIRMLIDAEKIKAVIPEGGEDVVVVQQGIHKLRQIKTRNESQNPWTTADILSILCKQYYSRKIFSGKQCCFHFVSDRTADTKTALKRNSYGALYRLRFLLDLRHDGQTLTQNEAKEFDELSAAILPKIKEKLEENHDDLINEATARSFLENTWIETDNRILRNPQNILELEAALKQVLPGLSSYTVPQLKEIYDRLLLLIIRKIVKGKSVEERKIKREDVLSCRVAPLPFSKHYPDLDVLPGNTPLEKKVILGGFDPTEISRFRRQKFLAERTIRQLRELELDEELELLTVAILDHQGECRQKVCREQGIKNNPGPKILSMLRPDLNRMITRYCSKINLQMDEQFCLGLLWYETNECSAWWHGLDNPEKEVIA